jgi:uncharacterized membrane protein
MEIISKYLDTDDILALMFFIMCWVGYAQFTDHKSQSTKSLLAVTNRYRLQWIKEMIRRDNRTMDTIMIGNLQRSITFFANTTIFILLGLMTMLGYYDRSSAIFTNIPFAKVSTPLMWELKIFLLIVIFIYAFFKYTWSLRQYNYASIFINSIPPHNEPMPDYEAILSKGSYLASNAAHHFNNGLRAYYFGLAALAWFIHPYAFIIATAWIVFVTHRREYHSKTLANLDN